jgi:hypothetical protein
MSSGGSRRGSPQSSREPSPVPRPEVLDAQAAARARAIFRSLANRVLVLVFAAVFAVFIGSADSSRSWRNSFRFFEFALRGALLYAAKDIPLHVLHGRGNRHLVETFFIAISFIAGAFFVIMCPFTEFLMALVLCAALAIMFHF